MTATTMQNKNLRAKSSTFDKVFSEVQSLFHRMGAAVAQIHDQGELTGGRRGVMRDIYRLGPRTVPQMARARPVSRQHIQQQVDILLERKLVRREPNPAHKRSPLIALTDAGRALIQNMRAEELHALSRLQAGTSDSAMRDATQVLAAWKEALSNDTQRRKR